MLGVDGACRVSGHVLAIEAELDWLGDVEVDVGRDMREAACCDKSIR